MKNQCFLTFFKIILKQEFCHFIFLPFNRIFSFTTIFYFVIFSNYFSQNLNWDKLARKEITAPLQPKINHELDVSNFSEEFTKMEAADSPAVVPLNGEKIFKVRI